MKTVDSCHLIGQALDWAVCASVSLDFPYHDEGAYSDAYNYSTNAVSSYEIIEREKISMIHIEEDDPNPIEDGPWAASVKGLDYGVTGPTALIAAMRCYVCLKLGETIEIPDELEG